MAHAVDASTLRFEHMSPTAAGMAATLHALVAALLMWGTPLKNFEVPEQAIEVTMEEPPAPKTEPPAQAPPPAAAQAAPAPSPRAAAPQASNSQLGVPPPREKPAAEANPNTAPGAPPPPEATKQEQQAAAPPPPTPREAPPSAPKPDEEKPLPEVAMPSPPLSMRDFIKLAPPPSPQEIVKPQPRALPTPPAPTVQQQPAPQFAPSPLGHAPQQPQQRHAPADSQASAAMVNPSVAAARDRAADEYFWAVIRKFSQYLPDLREKNQGGTVVVRIVIARDGRVIEAGIAKPSGVAALDKGMLEAIRTAAPYPPLPPELPGDQFVFTQPITAKR